MLVKQTIFYTNSKEQQKKVTIDLLNDFNISIKDLTGKRRFEASGYIRVAVRNQKGNDTLIAAMKEILESK